MTNDIISMLPLAQLEESPFNPRRVFTGLDESEAERLAQALTDWKSREVRDLDRLDAAAELRRLAALSESNAIDALNYESRIERLQAENDALRAMHDAAPKVEAEPVAWMDDFGNAFPLAANKGAGSWLDEHKRNWKPLYTHPAAPQPDALPEARYTEDEIADACMLAEIPDSKFESLLLVLKGKQ